MADEEAAPRELVVDAKAAPGDSSDGSGSGMAPIVVPVIGAGLLAKFVSSTAALVVLGMAVAFAILRRKPNEGRFLLRVDGGVLEVGRERGRSDPARVALTELLDVTYNKETRAASGRGGSPTERVRLALERPAPAPPIFVPEESITPLEAQEWYSKVRVFLRKHGWVPKDERAPSL
jgi:hypothetical protein